MRARCTGAAVVAVLALLPAAAAAQKQPNSSHVVHMHAKPAVVRIASGYSGKWAFGNRTWETAYVGVGSGSLISPSGYVLTNAHVVSMIKDGDETGKKYLLGHLAAQVLAALGHPVTPENVAKILPDLAAKAELTEFHRINTVLLPSGKRHPFEIKAYGAPVGEGKDISGKDVAILKIEVKNAPTLRLGDSDGVEVGDRIFVLGFPAAADSAVLDEKSALEPTTNDGSISAKKTSVDGAPILQTNTSATHGNSGGPALNEKGEIVGMLTFRGDAVNGQEVQGFNFIVPTSTIQEFVRQSGADVRPSPVDARWREGLQHYWGQRYSDAKDSFADVLALYPDHSEARRLTTESQERIARGEDKSRGLLGILLLGLAGAGAVVVAGGLGVYLTLRGRRKRSAGSVSYGGTVPARSSSPAPRAAESPARPPARGEYKATEFFQPIAAGKIECTAGPLRGQEFALGQGVSIGRDATRATIVVDDRQVSGQHVWIGPLDGRIIARDYGSTNGTFLNADLVNRVTELALSDGDVLTLGGQGSVKFTFRKL